MTHKTHISPTGIAALRRGCRFTGTELSAHYFSVSRERLTDKAQEK